MRNNASTGPLSRRSLWRLLLARTYDPTTLRKKSRMSGLKETIFSRLRLGGTKYFELSFVQLVDHSEDQRGPVGLSRD